MYFITGLQFLLGIVLADAGTGITPECPVVTAQECSSPFINDVVVTGTETARVSWLDPFHEPGKTYELEVVAKGTSQSGVPDITGISDMEYQLQDLSSGTEYDVYIRAHCVEEYSSWNGPIRFVTFIQNSEACMLDLQIEDDNCPTEQIFTVVTNQYPGMSLGVDIFIRSISMVIEHDWVADLSIFIESPTGRRALLTANHGVGEMHFGDPADSLCNNSLRFTMEACEYLTEENSPYIGEFIPDEDYDILHDGGPANGEWKILICDKAQDDVGALRYINIELVDNLCLLAPGAQLVHSADSSAMFRIFNSGCDSIRIAYGTNVTDPAQGNATTITLACTDIVEIPGLLPSNQYGVFFQNVCGEETSGWSCLYHVETACAPITLSESFDANPLCEAVCGAGCLLEGIWQNVGDDNMDWTVWEGPTPTNFTGPSTGMFGQGRFLFVESSAQACQDSAIASLESTCLNLMGDPAQCGFSFSYSMTGTHIGTLTVAISLDDGNTWEELLRREGEQSTDWEHTALDLSSYYGNIGKLRIQAITGNGAFGDIAIDELLFHGPVPADSSSMQYFTDNDTDGFGNPAAPVCLCSSMPLPGYTTNAGDCDDTNPDVNPDAVEVPCNLIDENCNGIGDDMQENPPSIQLVDQQDETCHGAQDGIIEITVSGPDTPYLFNWGDSLPQTSRLEGLSAGVYQCSITDGNGCLNTSPYYAVNIDLPIEYFLLSLEQPSCPGVEDGAITGIVQGGHPPYQYLWNTGDTTLNIDSIGNGIYYLTATDQMGCTHISQAVIVNANPTFQVGILSRKDVRCKNSNDGSITLGQIGGDPPFTFAWNTGDNTQMIDGLAPGTYLCTVTDAGGCETVTDSILISEPDSLEIHVSALDAPGCPGGHDGRIEIAVSGGTPPYFYRWSNGKFTDDLYFIPAGIYSVTVTDAKNCESILDPIVLEGPPEIVIELDSLAPVLCPGDDQGYISVLVSGGTGPYQFFWSNGSESAHFIEHLTAGTYAVTISDQNGCKASKDNIRIEPASSPISLEILAIEEIKCFGDSTATVIIQANGGTSPYWFNWSAGAEHYQTGNIDSIRMLPAGNYRVTVTDNKGCTGSYGPVLISQPQKLQYQLTGLQHNSCFGYQEGAIQLQVNGGVPPLLFEWSHGADSRDIDQLAAGSYSLTITDANACTAVTSQFTITEPDSVFLDFITEHASGDNANGSAEVSVTGGTPPYQYQWNTQDNPSANPSIDSLEAGWYSVTVTDGASCQYADSVFIDMINASVETASHAKQLRVYPNPGAGVFHVDLTQDMIHTTDYVLLINSDGTSSAVVYRQTSYGIAIDISGMPDGLYYLKTRHGIAPILKISQ